MGKVPTGPTKGATTTGVTCNGNGEQGADKSDPTSLSSQTDSSSCSTSTMDCDQQTHQLWYFCLVCYRSFKKEKKATRHCKIRHPGLHNKKVLVLNHDDLQPIVVLVPLRCLSRPLEQVETEVVSLPVVKRGRGRPRKEKVINIVPPITPVPPPPSASTSKEIAVKKGRRGRKSTNGAVNGKSPSQSPHKMPGPMSKSKQNFVGEDQAISLGLCEEDLRELLPTVVIEPLPTLFSNEETETVPLPGSSPKSSSVKGPTSTRKKTTVKKLHSLSPLKKGKVNGLLKSGKPEKKQIGRKLNEATINRKSAVREKYKRIRENQKTSIKIPGMGRGRPPKKTTVHKNATKETATKINDAFSRAMNNKIKKVARSVKNNILPPLVAGRARLPPGRKPKTTKNISNASASNDIQEMEVEVIEVPDDVNEDSPPEISKPDSPDPVVPKKRKQPSRPPTQKELSKISRKPKLHCKLCPAQFHLTANLKNHVLLKHIGNIGKKESSNNKSNQQHNNTSLLQSQGNKSNTKILNANAGSGGSVQPQLKLAQIQIKREPINNSPPTPALSVQPVQRDIIQSPPAKQAKLSESIITYPANRGRNQSENKKNAGKPHLPEKPTSSATKSPNSEISKLKRRIAISLAYLNGEEEEEVEVNNVIAPEEEESEIVILSASTIDPATFHTERDNVDACNHDENESSVYEINGDDEHEDNQSEFECFSFEADSYLRNNKSVLTTTSPGEANENNSDADHSGKATEKTKEKPRISDPTEVIKVLYEKRKTYKCKLCEFQGAASAAELKRHLWKNHPEFFANVRFKVPRSNIPRITEADKQKQVFFESTTKNEGSSSNQKSPDKSAKVLLLINQPGSSRNSASNNNVRFTCGICQSVFRKVKDMNSHILKSHKFHIENINSGKTCMCALCLQPLDFLQPGELGNNGWMQFGNYPEFRCKLCPFNSTFLHLATEHVISAHVQSEPEIVEETQETPIATTTTTDNEIVQQDQADDDDDDSDGDSSSTSTSPLQQLNWKLHHGQIDKGDQAVGKHSQPEQKLYKCSFCPCKFYGWNDINFLAEHVRRTHPNGIANISHPDFIFDSTTVNPCKLDLKSLCTCEICFKKFTNITQMNEHIETDHKQHITSLSSSTFCYCIICLKRNGQIYECSVCSCQFYTEEKLKGHLTKIHPQVAIATGEEQQQEQQLSFEPVNLPTTKSARNTQESESNDPPMAEAQEFNFESEIESLIPDFIKRVVVSEPVVAAGTPKTDFSKKSAFDRRLFKKAPKPVELVTTIEKLHALMTAKCPEINCEPILEEDDESRLDFELLNPRLAGFSNYEHEQCKKNNHQQLQHKLTCQICHCKKFLNLLELKEHICSEHLNRFLMSCHDCNAMIGRLATIQQLTNASNSNPGEGEESQSSNDFLCFICGDVFSSDAELEKHSLLAHQPQALEKKYDCDLCGLQGLPLDSSSVLIDRQQTSNTSLLQFFAMAVAQKRAHDANRGTEIVFHNDDGSEYNYFLLL